MVTTLRHRNVGTPQASGNFVMVGDSFMDAYTWGPYPGGQSADTFAAACGLTRVGKGSTAAGQLLVTAGGTGYSANFAVTFTGGTGTAAVATAIVFNGAVIGLSFSSYGNYSVAPTGITGGTGSGVAVSFTLSGGAIQDGIVLGNNSRDATRAAIGGVTMVSGGSKGHDFVTDVATRCTSYNPVTVASLMGTNDYFQSSTIAGFTSITKFKTDYQTALTAIKGTASVKQILLCSLIPMTAVVTLPGWATSKEDLLRQFNQAIHELALDNGCAFVPLGDFPASLLYTDGIHPTQTGGHPWIAQRMIDTVRGRF